MESGKNVATYPSPKAEVLQTVKDGKKTLSACISNWNLEPNGRLHINTDDYVLPLFTYTPLLIPVLTSSSLYLTEQTPN